MTIIQKIKLKNFKSFAKPIELVFGNDFNCIIGANGAGKSNLADGLCFVLGKTSAKSMRAEKSSHLIYNGGKEGTPAKEAEVSIIFDNSTKEFPIDSKEVIITRIVRQNGNSIYKINDETRTRQQIIDVLSKAKINPDGHNIILQGDIVHFMEMRPEQRRELIEEISGISVYEDKKQKALLELTKVESKLNEASIILTEREAYLREIQKERDQAVKFKQLETSIKENKATSLNLQTKEKENEKDEVESKISSHNQELSSINKNLTKLKELINLKKQEAENINHELQEKGETEQIKLNKEITDLKESLIKNATRIETLESELEKIKTRKQQLNNEIISVNSTINSLDKKKKETRVNLKVLEDNKIKLDSEIKKFKEKHGIQDIKEFSTLIGDIDKKIETLQYSILELQEKKQLLLRENDKIQFNLNSIYDVLSKIESSSKDSNVRKIKEEFKITLDELNKNINEQSVVRSQLIKTRSNLVKNNEELARLQAKNLAIYERTSADLALKRILSLKDKKVYGTIYQLGNVDEKHSLALEVAAGSRINSIITEDDETAAKCIKILKENKLGTATFLPLNKIRPSPPLPKDITSKGYALSLDLIKFDPKFKNAFSYIFGSTLVVDNIEAARKIGIGNIRMATLDGDLVESSGAMHGGFRRKTVSFKDENYDDKINSLENEILDLKKTINLLENRQVSIENIIIDLKEKKTDLEINLTKLTKISDTINVDELENKKKSLMQETKILESELKDIEKQINYNNKSMQELKENKQAQKDKLTLNKDKTITVDLTNLEQSKQSTSEEIVRLNTELKNIDTQINNIYLVEIEKTKQIINQHDKEYSSFLSELENLRNILKQQRNLQKENEQKEKQFHSNFRSLSAKRNKLNEDVKKLDSSIIREEEKSHYIEQKINNISLTRARFVAELEALNKEFEEFKNYKIRRNISLEDLKSEIKEFEKEMQKLGSVNLRALEVYETLEQEHKKLLEKTDKLKSEKEDVLKLMTEIEGKKKDLFMKTFSEISKNFTQTFSNLSQKGQAHLLLENPENPLIAGLDINVKLAPNKSLDIRSLSGGEKSLAALAFIFAIQEYQPASFYFLDEVDAALDKTNSELLSKFIAKYSKNAQYIVISHNDAVITEASQIYGISMQQNGISKVVSLKI